MHAMRIVMLIRRVNIKICSTRSRQKVRRHTQAARAHPHALHVAVSELSR
jgi:hypothetical protein